MVIILCRCNWGIPGVTELPPHQHYAWALVRHNGIEFKMHAHDVALNPKLEVLDQDEDLIISINWKEVYRCLSNL